MTFFLGSKSRRNLVGVHSELVRTVELAIQITAQDFAVHCGCRTLKEQQQHVANGTSWTMNSKHLKQADGFGHAVDLVPFRDGQLSWDWPGCYLIALAMSRASAETGATLVWGGVWDRPMREYKPTVAAVPDASIDYVARRKKLRRRAAIDGPHFEIKR